MKTIIFLLLVILAFYGLTKIVTQVPRDKRPQKIVAYILLVFVIIAFISIIINLMGSVT